MEDSTKPLMVKPRASTTTAIDEPKGDLKEAAKTARMHTFVVAKKKEHLCKAN